MCTPETVIGTTALSGILGAKGAVDSAKAGAAISNQTARQYNRMAKDAEQRGSNDYYKAMKEGQNALASQVTAMAANEVDSSSGSMASLLANTAGLSVYDALLAKNNAEREAYGYYLQEANQRASEKQARYTGNMGALGSLLASGISAGNKWFKYYGELPARPKKT